MKASQISEGNTYWDGKKGLRRVVKVFVRDGETIVRYVLLCGHPNGSPLPERHTDGSPLYGCYMRSFQRWAKEQVDFGPEALNKK